MLDYLLSYLAIGLLCVVIFPVPIWEKKFQFELLASFKKLRHPSLKVWCFLGALALLMIVIWPLYLVVVYVDWKDHRPMTEREIDEHCEQIRKEREAKRQKRENMQRGQS